MGSCNKDETKYVASGCVWFNYDDKTQDHYKCEWPILSTFYYDFYRIMKLFFSLTAGPASIDGILTNPDDRTGSMPC